MKLIRCFSLVCLVTLCVHAINMLHVCHVQEKVLANEIALLNMTVSPLAQILKGQADGWRVTLWIAIILILLMAYTHILDQKRRASKC